MACNKNKKPDFLGLDFLGLDFNVEFGSIDFPVLFKTLLFDKLPFYFKSEDTYKDEQGKGLLERFISIFGEDLDKELIPSIECYLTIINSLECEPKFLAHIGNSLGNPPDIFKTDEGYRKLLSYIVSIYKIKGTEESYKLFFSILGFDVSLNFITPTTQVTTAVEGLRYDSELIYDNDEAEHIYDAGGCEPCSQYDITLTPKPGVSIIVDAALNRRIYETIAFNEPINAILRQLTINS